jgi:hypothetical protein
VRLGDGTLVLTMASVCTAVVHKAHPSFPSAASNYPDSCTGYTCISTQSPTYLVAQGAQVRGVSRLQDLQHGSRQVDCQDVLLQGNIPGKVYTAGQ